MARTVRQALKGRGDFISDIYMRDMLYGATVRSPYARAHIRAIHVGALPPEVVCITAADIPGTNEVTVDDEPMPIIAAGITSYVGEPVAILAGPSQRAVVASMAAIEIEYAELEPVFSFTHPTKSQTILTRTVSRGDVDAALARSARRIEGTYRTGIQEHLYNEPQGAVAFLEEGHMIVRTASQWPFHVRSTVASALGVPEAHCIVRTGDPGIALDGKLWYPSVVSAHAALLAERTGQPVKLVYSNTEDFRYSPKRAPFVVRYATGVDEDGSICGADVYIAFNAGAYGVFSDEIIERVIGTSLALYECRDLRITATAVRTNLPPLNILSGFGSAAALFATETHTTRIAEITGEDPYDWRMRNLVGHRTATRSKARATSDRAERVLAAVAHSSDFARKHAAYELQKKRRDSTPDFRQPTQGIGIALGAHGAGFIGDHETRHGGSVVVRLETNGTAVLRTSAVPGSRSVATSWRGTIAETLGLDVSDVIIENLDTSSAPDSGPSTLSRNVVIISHLLEQACNAIQKKRFRSPLPIEVRRSYRPGKTVDFASRPGGMPFPHCSYGAAVVEVSIDPVTFESRVESVWLAVDAGRVLDEVEARRSLEMSIYQALEWATHEIVVYRQGAVDPRSYLAYRNIGEPVLPRIEVSLVRSSQRTPEGLGEIPQNCIPAALAAAVSQATGRYMDQVPTNPALIHDYLESE